MKTVPMQNQNLAQAQMMQTIGETEKGPFYASNQVLAINVQVKDAPMAGTKYDGGKLRLDLLPVDALCEVSAVLTFGANKYGDRNWEKGMKWSRLYGAALRHAFAMFRGEDRDPETGLLHSAHLACCALFLTSYFLRKVGEDDRVAV